MALFLQKTTKMLTKRRFYILAFIVVLLCIPFFAMQLTDAVQWSLPDFIFMGALLIITGFFIDFLMSNTRQKTLRIILISFVLLVFFLIWIDLAVGIFGFSFSGT